MCSLGEHYSSHMSPLVASAMSICCEGVDMYCHTPTLMVLPGGTQEEQLTDKDTNVKMPKSVKMAFFVFLKKLTFTFYSLMLCAFGIRG